jgi:hypothetical protein
VRIWHALDCLLANNWITAQPIGRAEFLPIIRRIFGLDKIEINYIAEGIDYIGTHHRECASDISDYNRNDILLTRE